LVAAVLGSSTGLAAFFHAKHSRSFDRGRSPAIGGAWRFSVPLRGPFLSFWRRAGLAAFPRIE